MVIHEAGIHDRSGVLPVGKELQEQHPTATHAWVDSGYAGKGLANLAACGTTGEVVRRDAERARWRTAQMPLFKAPSGFILVKRRWVVERTFAWIGRYRRLSKDCEGTLWDSRIWVILAALRLLVGRLASGGLRPRSRGSPPPPPARRAGWRRGRTRRGSRVWG